MTHRSRSCSAAPSSPQVANTEPSGTKRELSTPSGPASGPASQTALSMPSQSCPVNPQGDGYDGHISKEPSAGVHKTLEHSKLHLQTTADTMSKQPPT